jgi:hypothetical protein
MADLVDVLDVASPQAGISAAKIKAAGVEAVYVKLGGDNVGRYVAPHYAEQVESLRAEGLRIGHYWVPGKQDPIGAADYMAEHLHEFDVKSDFLVLDNETLDRGLIYSDADAARFVQRLQSVTGARRGQVKVYIGAADLRARQWPKLNALLPHGPIVASYGHNTGKRDHEPNLGGRFGGRWEGHQYTSQAKVAGYTVDRNAFKPEAFDYATGGPKAPKPVKADEPDEAPAKAPTKAPVKSKPETVKAPSKPKPVKVDEPEDDVKPDPHAGIPGKTLQTWARRGGYHGPIDGVLGENSWKGIQTLLDRSYGYEGPIDGVPGVETYKALQRLARKGGRYTGPIDGIPGAHTWAGVAKALGA